MKNIEGISDVGDLPYDLLHPILRKISNPDQLRAIEEASPHISEHSAEIWIGLIKRDIQGWDTKLLPPKDPTKWWKVYRKLKREDEAERAAAEAQLRAALSKNREDKKANSTQIVHAVIPQKAKSGWGASRPTAIGARALRNARTGGDALSVIKRQTAHAQQTRGVAKAVPSHELMQKRSTIVRAPMSMVSQYAKKAPPVVGQQGTQGSGTVHRTPVFVSRQGPVSERDRVLNKAINDERAQQMAREERLRQLTGGGGAQRSPAKASPGPSSEAQPPRMASPMAGAPVRKRPATNAFMPAQKRRG